MPTGASSIPSSKRSASVGSMLSQASADARSIGESSPADGAGVMSSPSGTGRSFSKVIAPSSRL